MIRHLADAAAIALGLFGDKSILLETAAHLSAAGLGPVVGGVAVFLHGYRRTTSDIDLYCEDPAAAAAALLALGATWDADRREHLLDCIPIRLVTRAQTGDAPRKETEIQGVLVISLADLIRFKLRSGIGNIARSQDLADVVALIRAAGLDKSFAARLPSELRADYRKLVEAVQKDEGGSQGPKR